MLTSLYLIRRVSYFVFVLFSGFLLFNVEIFAQDSEPPRLDSEPPRLDSGVLSNLVNNLKDQILPLAALVAIAVIVYGGYMWMISSGDPSKIKQAQGTLTWGIIGLIFLGILGMLLTLIIDYFAN